MPTPTKQKRKGSSKIDSRTRHSHSSQSTEPYHHRGRTDEQPERRPKPRESSNRREEYTRNLTRAKREPESETDDRNRRQRRNNGRKRTNPFQLRSDEDNHDWGKPEDNIKKEENKASIKPDFGLSGKLAEDTNTYNGVVIKYNEPTEARKPKRRWRLYPFKGDESLPLIPIHRQSAYLIGRSRGVVDIPTDHPSCSKQQAVLQYRLVDYEKEDGRMGKKVRPYIIDLDSSNGTFVNNKVIEPRRYVELLEKDVLKFGFSTREYVLLHEESKYDHEDDNVLE